MKKIQFNSKLKFTRENIVELNNLAQIKGGKDGKDGTRTFETLGDCPPPPPPPCNDGGN